MFCLRSKKCPWRGLRIWGAGGLSTKMQSPEPLDLALRTPDQRDLVEPIISPKVYIDSSVDRRYRAPSSRGDRAPALPLRASLDPALDDVARQADIGDGARTAAFWGVRRLGSRQIASLATIGALPRGARGGQPRPPFAAQLAGDALGGQAFIGV